MSGASLDWQRLVAFSPLSMNRRRRGNESLIKQAATCPEMSETPHVVSCAVHGLDSRPILEVSPPHEPPQGFKAVQGLKFIFHERFESVGKLSLVLGFKARIVSGNSHHE